MEAVHHIQQERQHCHSYTSELGDSAEGSQRLTVAGERGSDSSFLVGSDEVESLFCSVPKGFGCIWVCFLVVWLFGCFFLIQCLSTAKAINCPEQGSGAITPLRVSLFLGDSRLVHSVHVVVDNWGLCHRLEGCCAGLLLCSKQMLL